MQKIYALRTVKNEVLLFLSSWEQIPNFQGNLMVCSSALRQKSNQVDPQTMTLAKKESSILLTDLLDNIFRSIPEQFHSLFYFSAIFNCETIIMCWFSFKLLRLTFNNEYFS